MLDIKVEDKICDLKELKVCQNLGAGSGKTKCGVGASIHPWNMQAVSLELLEMKDVLSV